MTVLMLLAVAAIMITDRVLGLPSTAPYGVIAAGVLLGALAAIGSGRLTPGVMRLLQVGSALTVTALIVYRGQLGMEAATSDAAATAVWYRTMLHASILMATYAALSLDRPERTVPLLLAAGMAPLTLRFHETGALIMGAATLVCAAAAGLMDKLFRKVAQGQEDTQYELLEQIGGGGMGEVWLARYKTLARPAAVKIIRPDLLCGKDADAAKRLVTLFEREARATAGLRSANTVEVYDFGTTPGGIFYYVMEYLEGVDLEQLVAQHGAVSPERAVHWLLQACESLAEAHGRGLVHRDIKPANLHVGRLGLRSDVLKVLDFGLVKPTTSAARSQDAEDVEFSGTPAYASPESVEGEDTVDARTDIYALGCVAYWLLTGEHVFSESSVVKMLLAHADAAPVPPSERTELPVPACIDAAVLRCLAKDPADRFQTAMELRDALAGCDVGGSWSPQRADRWWDTHHPRQLAT